MAVRILSGMMLVLCGIIPIFQPNHFGRAYSTPHMEFFLDSLIASVEVGLKGNKPTYWNW